MSLQVLAYNLKRVMQILGAQTLIAAMRACATCSGRCPNSRGSGVRPRALMDAGSGRVVLPKLRIALLPSADEYGA
jgi:heterodisulfide reductase subunit C